KLEQGECHSAKSQIWRKPLIEKNDIFELRKRVGAMQRPILSLYADVHVGRKETLREPVIVRVKNTLRELPQLPHAIAGKVLAYFESRSPTGRSLAVFANKRQLEALEFDAAFIDDSASDRLNARVGEPYLTPLVAAMSEHEPYAIGWADRDNVHVFELFMEQAEPLFRMTRPPVAGEATEAIGQSENRMPQGVARVNPPMARSANTIGFKQSGPKFIADRGDAAKQLAHEHIAHAQIEFYSECGRRLRETMAKHGLQHVVILGPERDRHAFLSALPGDVARKVGALAPGNSKAPATGREVVELARPLVAKVIAESKRELLHAIEENG